MPSKRGRLEGAEGHALRDPRDMAKAKLLQPQFPAALATLPDYSASMAGPPGYAERMRSAEHSARWASENDFDQGDERGAYVTLDSFDTRKRWIAYGTRVLWQRSPHSSRRRYDPTRADGKAVHRAKGQSSKEDQRRFLGMDRQGSCYLFTQSEEVRAMRNAETVLGLIRDRGRRGLPLERIYRLLFNRNLYLLAYGKIASNAGAMTPGATPETVDGMAVAKIDAIIEALRSERYRWTPVRRVYIEKQHSKKKRPLGLPTWSDKLLQEVLRLILDAYYDPQFSDHSHGFRHGRGCHTALREVYHSWPGTAWFIELDVAQFFDRLDHDVLVKILAERIRDGRFLRLITNLLKAGYLEHWRFNSTLSGVPQGGIVSPFSVTSILTGWISLPKRSCCRCTPVETGANPTRRTNA